MCVSMHVAVWCGQLIACRLVWLMKLAAAEIDGAERWLMCVYICIHGWLRLNPTLVIRVETQC